ncbi:MAG TPA: MarR family transcriptional regulator [Acidimicrobiia bacterium]|nr:MarR family transcriptional regulator [Acidimicrobiia bacterium]
MTGTREHLLTDVAALLQELGRTMRAMMTRRLADYGMSPPMVGTLHFLDEPMAMSALADRLSCDASYVTGLADRLEERGLVERLADPSDRRVRQLRLTDKGLAMRRTLDRHITEGNPVLERLDDEELADLSTLLRKALDR